MTEEQLREENQKFMKNMSEMKERKCQETLNTNLGCSRACLYYGTPNCMHPEKTFYYGN